MQKILIISTEHVESGKCNSDELLKIIESINPDVIFEEEPNDEKYKSYYSDENSFKPLEIQTIIKYKLKHQISNIPVDKPINEFASLYLLDNFLKFFKQSQDYNKIIKDHCAFRNCNGFEFLNSKKCSELNDKKMLLEKHLISKSGPLAEELTDLYNQFHQELNTRELKMIENIYKFSKTNKFEKAVFFLGYAHRESLRKKLIELKETYNHILIWSFLNE